MQNRGAILTLAVLFFLVSIYQLSFTWVASNVRKEAKQYAHGNVKKEKEFLDSIATVPVYNFLGIKDFTYRDVQERELNLGLDLKGGMEVVLEVSVEDIIRSLANYSTDTTFNKALKLAKKMQNNSQEDFVTLFGKAFKQIDPNGRLAAIFNTLDLKGKINYNSTNEEVLKVIREEVKSAIDNSFNVLRTRIDRFGVTQPNIQKLDIAGRILIELPGVKDPERVRKLLQSTARLQFWETYDNKEIYPYLLKANETIAELNKIKKEKKNSKTQQDTVQTSKSEKNTNPIAKTDTAESDTSGNSLLAKLDSTKTGNNDTTLSQQDKLLRDYPLFAVLHPMVSRDGKEVMEGASVGIALTKDTAKVNHYLSLPQVKAILPPNVKFLWTVKPIKGNDNAYELVAIKITTRDGRPPLTGDVITDARPEFGNNRATAEVSMTMNAQGAKIWARLTKENIGRQIAIVLDNYVYSFPVVQSEIKGGRSSITGNFTVQEAQDLANVLKSGKLPAPAHIIEEAVVGPSLGKEAIRAGLISFIIAFIVVLLYMIFYYAKAGIAADIALLTNMIFIFGILASLGAVLTLPGIAGIVLTIGMSVDANVLIYERIREEIRGGKGLKLAVTDGYNKAYSSILDANITTLLTGIILYIFGTGPIQGFATTLIIGILTSLFTAIFVTRLVFDWWLNKGKNITFSTKLTENVLLNAKYPFIEKRKIYYIISGTLVLISFVALFTTGLNYGIDFVGGRTYVVRFNKPVSTVELAKTLTTTFGEMPEVKTYGNSNQVRIATKYMIDSENPDADNIVEHKLFEGLQPIIGKNVNFDEFKSKYLMSSEKVGPSIADDIKVAAFWAVIFALIVIFLYILIRFRNWQFGLGGVTALIHDTSIVLGTFAIFKNIMPFSMEIDQSFIAAILTVVGYSINDTVVIYDRIREYFKIHTKMDKKELFNRAMNSTLTRTINTSMTTFIVLLVIFLFGGEVIRGFVFAIMIGIVVGTYSSLFIASPITYDTMLRQEKKQKTKK